MSTKDQGKSGDADIGSAFDPGRVAGPAPAKRRDGNEFSGRAPDPDSRRSSSSNNAFRSNERTAREAAHGEGNRKDGGRLSRITGETRGLVEDLKEWVDLKIQLLQLDFEDRIRQAANQAALTAVVIVVALLAVLFALVAAGEALGAWFDSRSLGFLTLAGILALVAGVIHALKPRLVGSARTDGERTDRRALAQGENRPALPATGATSGATAGADPDGATSAATDAGAGGVRSSGEPTKSDNSP